MAVHCENCGDELATGETFIELTGGTVQQGDAVRESGGRRVYHPDCAVAHIREEYEGR